MDKRSGRLGDAGLWLALAFLALYLLSTGGDLFISDGEVCYKTTARIAGAMQLDLIPDPGLPQIVPGRNGLFFSKYGLGQPIAALPLFNLGDLFAQRMGDPLVGDRILRLATVSTNAVFGAGCVLLLVFIAGTRFGVPVGLMIAALYGLATPAWPYSKIYFSEPLLTFSLLLATWATLRAADLAPRRVVFALLAGLAAGNALLTKPVAVLALPVFAAYLTLAGRSTQMTIGWQLTDKRLLFRWRNVDLKHSSIEGVVRHLFARLWQHLALTCWYVLATLPAIGLVLLHNWARFGSISDHGYGGESFSTPLLAGLYGLLLSGGRGLLWYAPPVLLGLIGLRASWHTSRALTLLWAGLTVPILLLSACWWAWHGGWGWGPRLIMPVVPFVLLTAGPLLAAGHGWRLAWVLLLVGGLVQLPGVMVDFNQYMTHTVLESSLAQRIAELPETGGAGLQPDEIAYLLPEYSPISGQWQMLLRGEGLFVHSLDLTRFGIPAQAAVTIPATLFAVLGLSLAMLLRCIRDQSRLSSVSAIAPQNAVQRHNQ